MMPLNKLYVSPEGKVEVDGLLYVYSNCVVLVVDVVGLGEVDFGVADVTLRRERYTAFGDADVHRLPDVRQVLADAHELRTRHLHRAAKLNIIFGKYSQ